MGKRLQFLKELVSISESGSIYVNGQKLQFLRELLSMSKSSLIDANGQKTLKLTFNSENEILFALEGVCLRGVLWVRVRGLAAVFSLVLELHACDDQLHSEGAHFRVAGHGSIQSPPGHIGRRVPGEDTLHLDILAPHCTHAIFRVPGIAGLFVRNRGSSLWIDRGIHALDEGPEHTVMHGANVRTVPLMVPLYYVGKMQVSYNQVVCILKSTHC